MIPARPDQCSTAAGDCTVLRPTLRGASRSSGRLGRRRREQLARVADTGDPWEVPDRRTLAFSVPSSVWLVSAAVLVVTLHIASLAGLGGDTPNWLPALISGGSLGVISIVSFLDQRWRKAREV